MTQLLPDARTGERPRTALLLVGIVMLAATLRAPITGVGPLIGTIRHDVGIGGALAGVLTTLPVLAFGLVSPLAPALARRLGIERSLGLALAVLLVAIVIRSVPTIGTLFVGTVLLGAAIAIANVLLPSLVKRDFPYRVGAITSLYAAMMNVGAATASGIAVPVAGIAPGGWRTAIGCWAGLVVVALVVWSPQMRLRTVLAEDRAPLPWRSRLAWTVTLFMGLQSFGFYVVVSWLLTILTSHGASKSTAGWELFGFQVVALVSVFSTPTLIRRLPDQRWLAAGWSLLAAISFAGLLVAPGAALVWVVIGGLASGASLVLALSFFGLRTSGAPQAAALSGMAQAAGYLIAATGPVLMGLLHDSVGGWRLPLSILSLLAIGQLLLGYRAGRAGAV
jgi:CP family cyanate transporter-like MFS transporter